MHKTLWYHNVIISVDIGLRMYNSLARGNKRIDWIMLHIIIGQVRTSNKNPVNPIIGIKAFTDNTYSTARFHCPGNTIT